MNHLRRFLLSYGLLAVTLVLATSASFHALYRGQPMLPPLFYAMAVLLSAFSGGLILGGVMLGLCLLAGGAYLLPLYIDMGFSSGGYGLNFLGFSLLILVMAGKSNKAQVTAANAIKALAKRELEFATVLEALPVGIWFTDRNGRIVSGNKAAKEIWGGIRYVGPNELSSYKIFDPETRIQLGSEEYPISQALTGRHVQNKEVQIETFDKKHRRLLISSVPLRAAESGDIWGVVAINEDVTNREAVLKELRRAKEDAERANRAKDRFLAVLSHELRTPLTPVLMLAESLAKHPALPEELRADARMICRYVLLEARMIDDLLDLTRIEKGKLHLDREIVDLNTVLHSVVEMVQPQAYHKGIGLSINLNARKHFVEADRARIKQVIWNVLGNAIKFTPEGGGVALMTEDAGDDIRVIVKDTGIGIPPGALESIFSAFEQANTEHRRFGGLGLGLAIAKSLLELHGGGITAQSHGCGKGTAVMMTLPGTLKSDVQPAIPAKNRLPSTGNLRILIVEDHEPTAFVLTKLLRRRGHSVQMVASVREACSLPETPIDLLVSDIGLPDGSGLDVVAHYRARHGAFRAIALSGFGTESDVERSLSAGFDRHLTKPVDFGTLQEVVIELFQKNRV